MDKQNQQHFLSHLIDPEKPQVLATVVQAVSPTAAKPGDKALVTKEGIVDGWIGGGCAQPAVIATAAEVLRDGEARLIRVAPKGEWATFDGVADFYSGCLSGGSLMIFLERLQVQAKLTIFGNSPVAKQLARLSEDMDFNVVLAEPDHFNELDSDYIIIATQGQHDTAALKAALGSKAMFIGMVASSKKAKGLKERLAKQGFSETELNRIHSPIGLPIGAKTPSEIALSIVAELIQYRYSSTSENKITELKDSKDSLQPTSEKKGGCCNG
jgi:xanthine dehydrogenase accessory factor